MPVPFHLRFIMTKIDYLPRCTVRALGFHLDDILSSDLGRPLCSLGPANVEDEAASIVQVRAERGICSWTLKGFERSKSNVAPVRTLSVHHRLRNEQTGRSSSKLPPNPEGRVEAAAIALRTESPESSSGSKVLSVLENTDQMYAL